MMKKIILLLFFLSISCVNAQYLKSYEPINAFLKSEKINNETKYILRIKESNLQTLRIFNRGEGVEHVIYRDEIDLTSSYFTEKHWKKFYSKYAKDTLKKYWKNEDFPDYKFVEGNRNILFQEKFLNENPTIQDVIILSEPLYYRNKYVIFFFHVDNFMFSSKPQIIVIMKKEKNKWVVVEKVSDYSCSGCL
jgi:hypothetical protein